MSPVAWVPGLNSAPFPLARWTLLTCLCAQAAELAHFAAGWCLNQSVWTLFILCVQQEIIKLTSVDERKIKIIHLVVCCFLNGRIDKVCFPTGSCSLVPSGPLSSCNTCGPSSPSVASVPTSHQSRSCLLSLPVPAVPTLALLTAWAASRTQGCLFPTVVLLRSWAFFQR